MIKCYSCGKEVDAEIFHQQYNYCPECGMSLFKPGENIMYKILRCIDQEFWAYRFISDEHAKYTIHQMTHAKHDKVHYNADLLYIHSPDITPAHATTIPKLAHSKGVKVIGAYAGSPVFWTVSEKKVYDYSDLIVTISPQTYEFAKLNYSKDHPIIFLPESVDTKFFFPNYCKIDYRIKNNPFIVGWAGGAHKKIKRTYLLDKLDFPVIIKSDWKAQRKANVTTLDNMIPFYQSIDVLVITSLSECMPRVALEAMACGIPVISTDVGGMRMLIDKEFIVPVNPEENCISAINDKLQLFYKYPELRKAVGYRNRQHIEDYWSWEKNTKLWDKVFSLVIENKIDDVIKLADKFLDNFRDCFDLMRDRFRNVYQPKEEPIKFRDKLLTMKCKNKKHLKENHINTTVKLPRDGIVSMGTSQKHIDNFKNKSESILSPQQQVIYDIYNSKIPCWLLKNTCLDCVLYNGEKLTTNTIEIGVDNVIDKIDLINDLEELNYERITDNKLGKGDYTIDIIEIIVDLNRETKIMALLDLQVLVPMPVIKYLRQTFGNNWENLKCN